MHRKFEESLINGVLIIIDGWELTRIVSCVEVCGSVWKCVEVCGVCAWNRSLLIIIQ